MTNLNPAGNFANESLGQAVASAAVNSNEAAFWMDPTAALWVKACIAAGKSVGVPGCPSREVADFMYAALGA